VDTTEAATRSAICPDDIDSFSSLETPELFVQSSVRANASPVPELAPTHGDRPENKNAATEIAGYDGKGRSIPGGRRSTEKNLIGMTLAWLASWFF
jgi:hypothetical protein